MDHGLAASSLIQPMQHMGDAPLRIERDWSGGYEIIVIEGIRFDAEYFRTFAHPDVEVLYAVRREDDMVTVTSITNTREAAKFFAEVGNGN